MYEKRATKETYVYERRRKMQMLCKYIERELLKRLMHMEGDVAMQCDMNMCCSAIDLTALANMSKETYIDEKRATKETFVYEHRRNMEMQYNINMCCSAIHLTAYPAIDSQTCPKRYLHISKDVKRDVLI